MILPPDDYTLVSESHVFGRTTVTMRRRSNGALLGLAVRRDGESRWAVIEPDDLARVGLATSLRHAAAMLRYHARRQR